MTRTQGAKKATQMRSDKAKKKVTTAVNLMRMMSETMTISSVATEAGVSYNTAKKYKSYFL